MCVKFNFSLCLLLVFPSISTSVLNLQFSFHIQIQNVFSILRLPQDSQYWELPKAKICAVRFCISVFPVAKKYTVFL